jgi:hypothetical protein
MRKRLRQHRCESGFSLGEMLAAMVIGAMVLTAILTIYSRANQSAEAVLGKIEHPALATEVLQCLADDLERVLGSGQDTTIQIKNGLDNGLAKAQLVIRRTMRDARSDEKTFEEITWRAGYDYEGSSPGLVIYRAHEGVNLEDKLLDPKRKSWESNYPLVPLCRGVTFFRIEVPQGDRFVEEWSEPALPPGVRVTISFAQPHETVRGAWDVQEDEKISRTIAIDKTRKIKFIMALGDRAAADPNAAFGEQRAEQTRGKAAESPEDQIPQRTGARTPQRGSEKTPQGIRNRTPQGTADRASRRTNESPR